MMSNTTSTKIKFSLLMALFWSTFVGYTYIIVFLKDKGFSNIHIGTIFSINAVIMLVSQPIWGVLSDKLHSIKRVFIACAIISGLMFISLPFIESKILIVVAISLRVMFGSSLTTFIDMWMVEIVRDNPSISYGSIRVWGSIGFAVVALAANFFVALYSLDVIFGAYVILLIAMLALCLTLEDKRRVLGKNIVTGFRLGEMLKNYKYISVVIFAMLILIPNSCSNTFMAIFVEFLGGKKEQIGMILSAKAFMELPAFLCSARLIRKWGYQKVLILAGILFCMEQIAYSLINSVQLLLIFQLVHASAYALFVSSIVFYIYELSPDGLKTTYQTIATCIYGGITSIISGYGGGFIIDKAGQRSLYQIGTAVCIMALVVFVSPIIIGRSKVKAEG